jgi:hypothetical protein
MAFSEKRLSFRDPALNFFVRDVVRVVHFYTDLLGFRDIPHTKGWDSRPC